MEIIAGMYQLKVPIPNNPVGYVLPYVFEVEGGCAIIDPGWDADESYEALQQQLAEIGAGVRDIKQVIVTHVHPDHYGLAARVREASGAQVIVHEKDIDQAWRFTNPDAIGDWFTRAGMPAAESATLDRGRPFRRMSIATPDTTMKDGEALRLGKFRLEVIWTPGHSPGHACFYMRDHELLLSGDHVLPTISPNVSLQPGSDADPLGDYIHSLKKLRGLSVRRVLPAHEYSFDDLGARLDELEHHHAARLQEVFDAIDAGARTAYEIAGGIRWAIGTFQSFNSWTRRAAMSETLSHLRYLVRQGRLREELVDELLTYSRP